MLTSSAYLRWLGGHFSDQTITLDPAFGLETRHVVGQATGYSVDQIAPFVRSLRACFDGAVTLIVDDSPDMMAFLAEHRVFAVTLAPARGWTPHVVVSRMALFERILSRAAPHGHALLTDVRDVVFQGDPLSPLPTTIEAFDEQDGGVFRDHSLNRKYVGALAGGELRDVLDDRPALCVGTIVGPVAELQRLCRTVLMLCAMPRSELGGAFGADQAAFNLAVHLGLVSASVQPNFSRVATVGLPLAERLRVENGRIINPDESVSPIVHQYDRHTHLIAHVNQRWNVATGMRPRRHGPGLSAQMKKLSESILKRVPELR